MKVLGIISTATLFVLLGAAIPALAQDDHKEAAKPAQHEQQAKPAKQEQAKPAKSEEQAKPARQEQAKSANQEPKEQTKSAKQEPQGKPAQQAKPVKQQQKAKPEQRQEQAKATKPATENKPVKQTADRDRGNAAGQQHVQRTAADEQRQRAQPALRLSARGNSRIPDDRFRSNFGRGHEFHMGNPQIVDGYSRFQYGGYWFGFVQPWPVGWYYTDDVYVDYINGEYYLCNPSYPGDQVAISVVL